MIVCDVKKRSNKKKIPNEFLAKKLENNNSTN